MTAACKHPKVPLYAPDEQSLADRLNVLISNGETSLYPVLVALAITVVNEGKFTRETCPRCAP